MTVFFQHVGEKGAQRDFPRTIGTRERGLVHFDFGEIEAYLDSINDSERSKLRNSTANYAPNGFQIWGIPSGAKSVLRLLAVGDLLLLLEAVGPGGTFAYGGRVIGIPSRESFRLSQHLWGEQRFPLIVLLKGYLTNYGWYDFCDAVGYKRNWNPAGNTYRVPDERVVVGFGDEARLVRSMFGVNLTLDADEIVTDTYFMDDAELYFDAEEGGELLRQHLKRERSAELIRRFKAQLKVVCCSVCSFDFEDIYGDVGRGFIEAHHTRPLADMKAGDRTSIRDLIAVCSNCHRMLHRRYPALSPDQLRADMATAFERNVKSRS